MKSACVAIIVFAVALNAVAIQVSDYVSHTSTGNVIIFSCAGTHKVRIKTCSPSVVQAIFDPAGTFSFKGDLLTAEFVDKTFPDINPAVSDEGPYVKIQTSALTVRVQKSPFRIRYYDASNTNLITGDHDGRGMTVDESPWLRFTKTPSEHFFGFYSPNATLTGRIKLPLDRTGTSETVDLCEAPMMYSTGGYAVLCLFETTQGGLTGAGSRPSYNATAAGYNDYSSSSTVDNCCGYFFFHGPSWREMIDRYTAVTGRPQKLDKKYYGIHRTLYFSKTYNAENLIAYAQKMRDGKFPCDVLRIDCMYNDLWGVIATENPPQYKVDALSKVKNDYHFRLGSMFLADGFSCAGVAVESSQPIQYAIDHGFDYAWYDAVSIIERSRAKQLWELWNAGHGGDETKTFVAEGWATSVGQSILGGHTGDGLNEGGQHVVVRANLEQSLLGYHCSYTDLGEKDPWNYAGTALRPMIQFHVSGAAGATTGAGQASDAITEPWTYSTAIQDVVRKWGDFHYRFIPYLFTYAMIANETGMPVWRAMVCHHSQDPDAWDKDFQAYVGEEMIISPYYDDQPSNQWAGTRKGIWLPSGVWHDYNEGTRHSGPVTVDSRVVAETNYEWGVGIQNYKLPVFVKEGAIIPLMEPMLYVGEKPESHITLCIWPSASSEFTLYEDETPVKTTFRCTKGAQQTDVLIGGFAGSRYCPDPAIRTYAIELHHAVSPQAVISSGEDLDAYASKAELDAAGSGWYFDAAKGGVTYARATGNAGAGFGVSFCYDQNCAPVSAAAGMMQSMEKPCVRAMASRRIACGAQGPFQAVIINSRGKTVSQFDSRHMTSAVMGAAGLYLVKIKSRNSVSMHRLIVR